MQNTFFSQKFSGFSVLLLAATLVTLTGCGSGVASGTGGSSGTPTTVAATTTTTLAAVPSLTIALNNASGVAVNSIPATVKATVLNATGAAVPNVVVTFSTDAILATLSPANGTALTNALGVASISIAPASLSSAGASTITASAQVGASVASGSLGYSVGSTSVAISNPVFGVGTTLSAFGTTSVTVNVTNGGEPVTSPQIVTFSSLCASNGKAVLSTSVTTVSGVATASYRDNGCAGTDTVTATVSGIAISSAVLTVTAPQVGSIKFISATPPSISLAGTGGTTASTVVFQVVDNLGQGISGQSVSFALSVTSGGITLTPASGVATSSTNGHVQTTVNSGTFSTPVRVTASTTVASTGVVLTTQSSALSITTGIPDQFGMSLAASTHNIEGLSTDGTVSVLTTYLADHFKNPVPDGTSVVFTSEASTVFGNCSTVNGVCTTTFTSSGTRPSNGRATVLAYAVGEETFTDYNANGVADLSPNNEMFDPNGNATDMGEAFIDYNEDDTFNAGAEPFIPFTNTTGVRIGPDGKYSGILCGAGSSAGTCAASKTIHVRQSQVIVLSGSTASITIPDTIVLPPCTNASGVGAPTTLAVTVVDDNRNAMPAGTKVKFTTSNGTFVSTIGVTGDYIQPDTIGCRTGGGCPASSASLTFGDIPVTMKSDGTWAANVCTPVNGNSGLFTVTVTAPSGLITTATAIITD